MVFIYLKSIFLNAKLQIKTNSLYFLMTYTTKIKTSIEWSNQILKNYDWKFKKNYIFESLNKIWV